MDRKVSDAPVRPCLQGTIMRFVPEKNITSQVGMNIKLVNTDHNIKQNLCGVPRMTRREAEEIFSCDGEKPRSSAPAIQTWDKIIMKRPFETRSAEEKPYIQN